MILKRSKLVIATEFLAIALLMASSSLVSFSPLTAQAQEGGGGGDGEDVTGLMQSINADLEDKGLNIEIAEIQYFTVGERRSSDRLFQTPHHWVPYDERRSADEDNIIYLVDRSEGSTSSGLSSSQTEDAIDSALDTLQDDSCMDDNVDLNKQSDDGTDPDIFDSFVGYGAFGEPHIADIVNAGWLPPEFFETLGPGGSNILAIAITFIFTDEEGNPTDINDDDHLDTALAEIYYNDAFGKEGTDHAGSPWGIDVELPGIDVESVALHENGHGLSLGHFGPPPEAVMNPVYSGIQQDLLPADHAGLCNVWASWPNR